MNQHFSRLLALTLILCVLGCASPNPPVEGGDVKLPGPAFVVDEQDPTFTDGDKYHVVLENDEVRVLRYHDMPGDKTQLHHHRKFVLYTLSAFRRRLSFPDGTARERDFGVGEVIWMPEQIHMGENTGTTDTEVLIVEIKS